MIVGPICNETTGQHAREHRDKQEKQHRKELLEYSTKIVIILRIATLLTSLLLAILLCTASLRLMAEKHKVKEVLRRDKVFICKMREVSSVERVSTRCRAAALTLSSFESGSTAQLIVLTALCGVCKTGHGRVDLFECLVSLRCSVLVRMQSETLLLVCSLQVILIDVPAHAQNCIVVVALEDLLGQLLLLRSELFRLRRRGRGSSRCGRTCCS